MERITQIIDWFTVSYGYEGICLMSAVLILFIIQLCYWLGRYARIPKYRNADKIDVLRKVDGITIIVILTDNFWYLDEILPKIMSQDYERFEVMIVSVGSGEDFEDQLEIHKSRYPNLSSTHMDQDQKFPISGKMAYNVGIKGAKYEHVILTTEDTVPVSHKWLSLMAKGFETGEVLIGYCGLERKRGFGAAMARCSRLMISIRYLSSAIAGRAYRGVIQNLGFTRDQYFSNKGFNFLNMNMGEDDLFVQKLARGAKVSVVMNPNATVRQEQWGGLGWWWSRSKFYGASYRMYPTGVKGRIALEIASRLLFYSLIVYTAIAMPWQIGLAAGVLWVLRLLIVRYQLWRIRKRLGEPKLGAAMMLYDLISPVVEIVMAINRKVKPSAGIWR